MSVTSADLLNLAKAKIASANSEIEYRCIVGRAYYAAYHYANTFHDNLLANGVSPSSGTGMHATLIHQLINPSIPHTDPDNNKSRSIGYILKGLHQLRKKADYYINEQLSLKEAKTAILESEKILAK